jgi:hypothetical protein
MVDSPNNLRTYQDLIAEALGGYFDRAPAAQLGGSGSSYSTNLYETVSNYLNTEKTDSFVSAPELFAKDGLMPDQEDVEKRTLTSKSFLNEDGTYSTVLNQIPIHYLDSNGEYADIDLTVRTSKDGGYEVVKNTFKTYFEDDASTVKVDLDGSSWVQWTPVEQRYVDKYGLNHELSTLQTSEGQIDGITIRYEGTFTDTTEEYIVNPDQLKHNLHLSAFPQSAGNGMYLSYVGKLELAPGLVILADGRAVEDSMESAYFLEVFDQSGELLYELPPPFAYEQGNEEESVQGTYSIEVIDGEIYLSMNTPVDWLNDPARSYPVVIDPTITSTFYNQYCGYALEQYYYRHYWGTGQTTEYTRWYNYYPAYYDRYLLRMGTYYYHYNNSYSNYTSITTSRGWAGFNVSTIDPADNIVQIDMHGEEWRGYKYQNPGSPPANSWNLTMTIRELDSDLNPLDYSSYGTNPSSEAELKYFYEEMVNGSVFNSSVYFPTGYNLDIDVYALGGMANTFMENAVDNGDPFQLALHRTVELPETYEGYGYFYTYEWNDPFGQKFYLKVTHDPCPREPIVEHNGPFWVPEGTTSVTLDASGSLVCGTSVLYMWDTNEDNIYDKTSSSPVITWSSTTDFADDDERTLKLKVWDLTLNKFTEVETKLIVANADPVIVAPSTPISGVEGSWVTLPAIQFTDAGTLDTHRYEYDINGDWNVDFSGTIPNGTYEVPSVSWYFCDNAKWVNLTVYDDDGGMSDTEETQTVETLYDGYLQKYVRDANPSLDYAYVYMYNYDYGYYTLPIYRWSYLYYDYEYRPLMKFNTTSVPSTFTPTNVTLEVYLVSTDNDFMMGVNNMSKDPRPPSGAINTPSERLEIFRDAGDYNILANEEFRTIRTSETSDYIDLYLDPSDFINRWNSSHYAVAFDYYDATVADNYAYFYGARYTTLTVSDGTTSYELDCQVDYQHRYDDWNGAFGYVYGLTYPARDLFYRETEDYYNYVDDYIDDYDGLDTAKSFIKFDKPVGVDPNKEQISVSMSTGSRR